MTKLLKMTLVLTMLLGASLSAAPMAVAEDYDSWKKALLAKVAKKFRYPRSAIQRGVEGKAKIKLIVAADGTITAHEIIEATGQRVLDREIPRLVKRLSPLNSLPDNRETVSIDVPLVWRLQ